MVTLSMMTNAYMDTHPNVLPLLEIENEERKKASKEQQKMKALELEQELQDSAVANVESSNSCAGGSAASSGGSAAFSGLV